MDRIAEIETRLRQHFAPLELVVRDDAALHVGHANEGRGHFAVRLVSAEFAGMSRLERHRRVYAVLGELMQSEIHAINIAAFAPDEVH